MAIGWVPEDGLASQAIPRATRCLCHGQWDRCPRRRGQKPDRSFFSPGNALPGVLPKMVAHPCL